MSFILQLQRRAIEEVFEGCFLRIVEGQKYFLGNDVLSLLGISIGVGTCSDLHDIDIAVFSNDAAFNSEINHLPILPKECRGAVLLRRPFEGETDPKFPNARGGCVLAVEGMRIVAQDEKVIRFALRRQFYVNLV